MTFHHKPDQSFTLRRFFVQELLRRSLNADLVRLDLDLSDGLNVHGYTLIGVKILLRRDVKTHELERQFARLLNHWPDDLATADDNPRTPETVHNECLVWSHFAKHCRD